MHDYQYYGKIIFTISNVNSNMADKLSNNRIERRFILLPTVSLNLENYLTKFKRFYPQENKNTITQSIYFSATQSLDHNVLVRVRRYTDQPAVEILELQADDNVYLEIKSKSGQMVNKVRVRTTYRNALNTLSKKNRFNKFIKSNNAQVVFTTPFRPLLATQVRRDHYHPIDQKYECRITVDREIRYFSFSPNEDMFAVSIGTEGMDKMEVKFSNDEQDFGNQTINDLLKLNAKPVDSLQSVVFSFHEEHAKIIPLSYVSLYRSSLPQDDTKHSLSKLQLVDEFPGLELELKLEAGECDPIALISSVRDAIKNLGFEIYSLVKDKHEVSSIFYFIDYYGIKTEDRFIQAFAIARNPFKKWFVVQCKINPSVLGSKKDAPILEKEESKFRVNRSYISTDLDVLKAVYENKFGKEILFVGTNARTKYFIYVFNNISGRYYNIAVDASVYKSHNLIQLEIEYKGKSPDSKTEVSKQNVLAEISQLAQIFLKLNSYKLKPSSLSKFDWLQNIAKNGHIS